MLTIPCFLWTEFWPVEQHLSGLLDGAYMKGPERANKHQKSMRDYSTSPIHTMAAEYVALYFLVSISFYFIVTHTYESIFANIESAVARISSWLASQLVLNRSPPCQKILPPATLHVSDQLAVTTENKTQGWLHGRPVLYHLSYSHSWSCGHIYFIIAQLNCSSALRSWDIVQNYCLLYGIWVRTVFLGSFNKDIQCELCSSWPWGKIPENLPNCFK